MIEQLDLESLKVKVTSKDYTEYLNIPVAFDIETSSIKQDGKHFGLMYAWALVLDNKKHLALGRTWEEFTTLLDELVAYFNLNKSRRLVIYVHNLSYEFQYMRKYLEFDNVFTVGNREPINALTTDGIEFRDSYILSGQSLENTGKLLAKHDTEKLVGSLDYTLVRHANTKLSNDEINYLINDVLVVADYIKEQLEIYNSIGLIPITATRRVRDFVRNNSFFNGNNHDKSSYGKYKRYKKLMSKLTLDELIYFKTNKAFQGGYVHANKHYINKVVKDVTSKDITSSYPSVMITEKYPMSKGKRVSISEDKPLSYWLKSHLLVLDIELTDFARKQGIYEDYISESNTKVLTGAVVNNGRVSAGNYLEMTITNVDLGIIEKVYDYEDIRVKNVIAFEKGYLPPSIRESIKDLYLKKTELKGIKGKELEAQMAKEMLNSVYGMTVTDIVRLDNPVFNTEKGVWTRENISPVTQVMDYNENERRFLYYPWGVFISAYARRNLWTAIINLKDDYVYSDTDSVKYVNASKHEAFFQAYNNRIDEKIKLTDNLDDFSPIDNTSGKRKTLGHFNDDGEYKRFKTLGAKMYLAETKDGDLEMTVSGLNKNSGLSYIKEQSKNNTEAFKMFDKGLTIPSTHSGKINSIYNDDCQDLKVTDYQGNTLDVTSLSSVYMEPVAFTIDEVKLMEAYIDNLKRGIRAI